MKLTIRTIDPVMVLDKSKKPWEMNGNKGVVYTAICHKKVDDDVQVEKVRITEDVYHCLEPLQKYHFDATIDVKNSRMEVFRAYPASDGDTAFTGNLDGSASAGNPTGKDGKGSNSAGKPVSSK